jgi:uncharacterized protein
MAPTAATREGPDVDRRWLLIAPSLVLMLLVVPLWVLWPPPTAVARFAWPTLVLLGLATGALLLALAALLERSNASFRHASRRLEHLVRGLRLDPSAAAGLALVTGVAEEVFFRGWLLHVAGLWGQAAVFMLLHPAGRRGWAYTVFTGFAGLVFGLLTLATGSLVSAVVAHVAVNLHGFVSGALGARRRAGAEPGRRATPGGGSGACSGGGPGGGPGGDPPAA